MTTPSSPSVLVVGAGAVGRVFAHHLQRSGAAVSLCVRDPARAPASATLRQLGLFGPGRDLRSVADAVLSRPEELSERRFDEVYITVPSDALTGEWMRSVARCFDGAVVVALTGDLEVEEHLARLGVPKERLVRGLLSIVSYASPLGSSVASTDARFDYWFPPLAPCLFDGPDGVTDAVVARLRSGGLPARRARDVSSRLAFFSAVLLVHIRALELQGWSIARYNPRASNAPEALRQALAVTARALGSPVPWAFTLAPRAPVGPLLRLARFAVPFPLEEYLRVHFTKVAPQTRQVLGDLVERGRAEGLAVDAVASLLEGGTR